LPDEDLEKKFIAEAKAAGFVGLKGHRSVGGIRVSLYNALPLEGAQKLAEFMEAFRKKN
jgi:phosphoserine aminotransferase